MELTKTTTREEMINQLKANYPRLFVSTTEEFDGTEGGVWLSAEDGTRDAHGWLLFDYDNDDFRLYDLGVRIHLIEWAEDNGWTFEFYDAGTVMMYQD